MTALTSESIFEISGGLESLGKFSNILETESLTSLVASSIFLFSINLIVTFDLPSPIFLPTKWTQFHRLTNLCFNNFSYFGFDNT